MQNTPPYPLQLTGELSPRLRRGLWLVKWLLAIPHYIVLAFLWTAFAVVTVIATGERLDLARDYLPRVEAPVLLLAGENDAQGTASSRQTLEQLHAEKKLETIGGAGHLFEDTSTQEEVARLAGQ